VRLGSVARRGGRDPNRKGSVEHAIGHTQGTALKGRRFESIDEQNACLVFTTDAMIGIQSQSIWFAR